MVRQFVLFVLLAVGSSSLTARTANTVATQPEASPASTNSINWEDIQQLAGHREQFTPKNDSLPDTASGDALWANSLDASAGPLQMSSAAMATRRAQHRWNVLVVFFSGIVFILMSKRFAPGMWDKFTLSTPPEERSRVTGPVRSEGESFDKFLTNFRVGQIAQPADRVPAQAVLARDFFVTAPGIVIRQKRLIQDIVHHSAGLARQKLLLALHEEMGALKTAADFPDALPIWQTALALEGLLQQLTEKMGNVTPSTLRTVVAGVKLLDELCAPSLRPASLIKRPLKFLVVDDDLVSRYALTFSLGKAFTQPDVANDAESALVRIKDQAYDVIFLDVQMPGMDGFELCLKVRQTILNEHVPVVFVSTMSDFNARAKSTMSGGNDLMGKPFLTFELTVKALTLALHGRLHGRAPQPENISEWMEPLLDSFAADEPIALDAEFIPTVPIRITPEEFNRAFLMRALKHIDPLRSILHEASQAPHAQARQICLVDAFLRLNSMVSEAGCEARHPAYLMTMALEGLLRKLLEDAKRFSDSTMATLIAGVDVLHELCALDIPANLAVDPPVSILVVDDDLISRRVITMGVQTFFPRPEAAESGEDGVTLAATRAFELVFMDVVMPGIDGFAASAKIRDTALNRSVPVVFVTGQPLDQVGESVGGIDGADYMVKPYLVVELTVKALTHVLRGRLAKLNQAADSLMSEAFASAVA